MEIKIRYAEIQSLMGVPSPKFPLYVTQILNLANQTAQGTRPSVVGKMTELVPNFPGRNLSDWATWYLESHPEEVNTAIERIKKMINNYREAIKSIDEHMIRTWVVDLIVIKTFIGIKFQEAILKKLAEKTGKTFRYATSEEESKGIDGYIGNTPISIKPVTYKGEKHLPESIDAVLVYYRKEEKKGITVEVPDPHVFI